ncbi:hypothetical protein M427DRAFT_235557 [Gonapodya prolifera JEL478]|uniref:Uncharacterized protein n=1 Tax=Gonapodya prolifera (strain JEL478) TaxID=1344416 RepID=A0A139AMD4_GONPJ|nr:hypothetical protein M427DRAFT_235557 [Gonapodya prolifera JEL478]|eukprot:KXS17931.1 hypothetical protein M427DRAFT_235557 [Gonapodya prolifera JEL478]
MGFDAEPEPAPPPELSQDAPELEAFQPRVEEVPSRSAGKRKANVFDDSDRIYPSQPVSNSDSVAHKRPRVERQRVEVNRDRVGQSTLAAPDTADRSKTSNLPTSVRDRETSHVDNPEESRPLFESMIPAASAHRPRREPSPKVEEDDDPEFATKAEITDGKVKPKKGGGKGKKGKTEEEHALEARAAALRQERLDKQKEDDEIEEPEDKKNLVTVEYVDIVVEPVAQRTGDRERAKGKEKNAMGGGPNFKNFKKQLLAPFAAGINEQRANADSIRRYALPPIPVDELVPFERQGEERLWVWPSTAKKGGKGKSRRAKPADRWGFPVDEESDEKEDDPWIAATAASNVRNGATSRNLTPAVSSEVYDLQEVPPAVAIPTKASIEPRRRGAHIIEDSDEEEPQMTVREQRSTPKPDKTPATKRARLLDLSDEENDPGQSPVRTTGHTVARSSAKPAKSAAPSTAKSVAKKTPQARKAKASKSQAPMIIVEDEEEEDTAFQWKLPT